MTKSGIEVTKVYSTVTLSQRIGKLVLLSLCKWDEKGAGVKNPIH